MKLKTAKRVSMILALAVVIAVIAAGLTDGAVQMLLLGAILVLLAGLAIISAAFLKCPHCRGQLHLWGMKHCPVCGRKIEA